MPGFGETPLLTGEESVVTLADAVAGFIADHDRTGIDLVGSSLGGRLVLELARRGAGGATVALDPGGFWSPWGAAVLQHHDRAVDPPGPAAAADHAAAHRQSGDPHRAAVPAVRRPWALPADLALQQMRSFAECTSFDEVLHDLVHGPRQEGAPAASTGPVAIGWGRKDRLTPVRPDAPPSCSPTRAWSGSTAPGTSRTGTDQRRPMCLILAATG